MILGITIVDRNLTEFLVEGGSLCNILYSYMMELIGIQQEDLNPYSERDLLAFNDSTTLLQGVVDLAVIVGEGDRERKVMLNFVLIPCQSAFREAQAEREPMDPGVSDLDAHEDEVRSVLDGDFESVQLREDPARSVKLGTKLSLEVRATLIGCL
ncbi:hypothetical protein KIW84_013686 [Lathyrus oleraceus]|uniref:Uncharacterized protein n=1 Tax=Pisum sativum TaxID=3888 RepID=A0A9D5GY56_PEA|nr:hypothetical protein KIW84_013686 [Pisum sativum]